MIKDRHSASATDVQFILKAIKGELERRIKEKGDKIFVSKHEILGIVEEEYNEFKAAVRADDNDASYDELLDIIVGAVWGLVSMKSGKMDW